MALDRDKYTQALKSLLGNDPEQIRQANRMLYKNAMGGTQVPTDTEADLVLAEASAPNG